MRRELVLSLMAGSFALMVVNWFWIKYGKETQINQSNFTSLNTEACGEMIKRTIYNCNPMNEPHELFPIPVDHNIAMVIWDNDILQKHQQSKKFLTIGIPSVKRKKGDYLFKTLKSIINNSSPKEQENITVVVLLADTDPNIRYQYADKIKTEFEEYIETGFLHVIHMATNTYPPFTSKRRTFGDTEERIRWRAKQVIDFSYLLNYSTHLSEYFLILEDDVICVPHFITHIDEFIQQQKTDWVSLTFSAFLIIGRLFKTSDLPRLVSFLMLFYIEKPVDLLALQFMDLLVPPLNAVTRRVPSLFQHVGVHSSLDGKVQKLVDKSFVEARKFTIINPPADIFTTLSIYKQFYPELAYNNVSGHFWGFAPKKDDTFDIIFSKPIKVTRIYVTTGLLIHEADILQSGQLEVSTDFVGMKSDHKAICSNFTAIARFNDGIVDVNMNNSLQIQCIRISVLQRQKNWLIISEIAVFT